MDSRRVRVPTQGAVALNLLGGFCLRLDDTEVELPLSVQRVLAFLVLRDRPQQRAFVAGSLWPESSDQRAHASLRSALWRLGQTAPGTVSAVGSQLGVRPDLRSDTQAMVTAARSLIDPGAATGPVNAIDRDLFTRDLLPDWYDDWVMFERERLRQLRMNAMESLATRLATEGHYALAVDCALTALGCEALRESAHRTLIEIHLAHGNYSEALRQYEFFRSTLERELGLEPSPHVQRLFSLITQH